MVVSGRSEYFLKSFTLQATVLWFVHPSLLTSQLNDDWLSRCKGTKPSRWKQQQLPRHDSFIKKKNISPAGVKTTQGGPDCGSQLRKSFQGSQNFLSSLSVSSFTFSRIPAASSQRGQPKSKSHLPIQQHHLSGEGDPLTVKCEHG